MSEKLSDEQIAELEEFISVVGLRQNALVRQEGRTLRLNTLRSLLNAARAEARPAVDREGEPSEDFIRLVAEVMGERTGYSISLTRLVDGVETYTLSLSKRPGANQARQTTVEDRHSGIPIPHPG